MPSFDIVSKVDPQTLDNAINSARKEILGRFDFRGTQTIVDLDKKNLILNITTEDEMRLNSIIDIIRNRMIKQQLDARSIDLSKEHYASGPMIKKEIRIKQGVDKDTCRKIQKDIKDLKLKVQAQQMDDMIRVTGKKIDELQAVIGMCRRNDYELPLQFVNMK